MSNKAGLVSFTFDDVMQSAVTVGARILAQQGLSGTFYVCGGLVDEVENDLSCYSKEDLKYLIRSGHEIGAHTYRHAKVTDMSKVDFLNQADENDVFISSIDPSVRVKNFSYPFGLCDIKSKRWAAARYDCARGIASGLNSGWVDLAQLKAIPLYSDRINEKQVHALIDRAVKHKAWLIFYTHDVSDYPSRFGCTPALLQSAVEYASIAGAQVLPVQSALDEIAFR
jgi:peptidoglycan/xylan/chitin deacetylase (PgdA/CDA1 family)